MPKCERFCCARRVAGFGEENSHLSHSRLNEGPKVQLVHSSAVALENRGGRLHLQKAGCLQVCMEWDSGLVGMGDDAVSDVQSFAS